MMKKSQLNAIYYSEREKRLKKIESLGMMDEYLKFKGDSQYHKIELFAKKYKLNI